jgi:hypothetical protein
MDTIYWREYYYDVQGNAKDGYEINNVFKGKLIEVPIEVETDEEWIKYLRKIGFIKKGINTKYITINGDNEILYFSYKDKPEFELRRYDL